MLTLSRDYAAGDLKLPDLCDACDHWAATASGRLSNEVASFPFFLRNDAFVVCVRGANVRVSVLVPASLILCTTVPGNVNGVMATNIWRRGMNSLEDFVPHHVGRQRSKTPTLSDLRRDLRRYLCMNTCTCTSTVPLLPSSAPQSDV